MNKEAHIRNANAQVVAQGNLDVVEEFFTADYLAHSDDKDYKGHDFIKRYARQIRKALPDLSVKNVEFLVHDGNTIAWQRTLQGTHKANLMGIPASDKKVVWKEMVVSRFEEDKIAEEWVVSQLAGKLLLKQPKISKRI